MANGTHWLHRAKHKVINEPKKKKKKKEKERKRKEKDKDKTPPKKKKRQKILYNHKIVVPLKDAFNLQRKKETHFEKTVGTHVYNMKL